MTSLLKWWLIVCLTLLGLGTCIYFELLKNIYTADVTRISLLILFIFRSTCV